MMSRYKWNETLVSKKKWQKGVNNRIGSFLWSEKKLNDGGEKKIYVKIKKTQETRNIPQRRVIYCTATLLLLSYPRLSVTQ